MVPAYWPHEARPMFPCGPGRSRRGRPLPHRRGHAARGEDTVNGAVAPRQREEPARHLAEPEVAKLEIARTEPEAAKATGRAIPAPKGVGVAGAGTCVGVRVGAGAAVVAVTPPEAVVVVVRGRYRRARVIAVIPLVLLLRGAALHTARDRFVLAALEALEAGRAL